MDKKLCRVCCVNNRNVSNIFQADKNGILTSNKIMYCCANVKITEEDGLPSYICNNCETELSATYQFVLKCEATDKSLRSQLFYKSKQNDSVSNKSKFEIKTEINGDTPVLSPNENDISCNYDSSDDFDIPLAVFNQNIKPENNDGTMKHEKEEKVGNEFMQMIIDVNVDAVSNKRKLQKNKARHKYKETGPQKCSICGRKCHTPSALNTHMRSHTNVKPYQCPSCEKCYKDPGSLKRHKDRNHLKNRERKFICETCGKGFFSKTDVVTHFRSHTGETPFICSECPSSFTQLSSLIRHKTKHSTEKPHMCPTCSKRFSNKDQLNAHIRVHTEIEKQFSCPLCQVQFKYKASLNKHMKMHNDPNRFVCNYCGRMFNLKGNLKGHIDRVHSEKSGFCNICSKMVSNIEVHTWRHTGERPLKCEHCTSCFYELKALAHHMNFRHKHPDKYKCSVDGCFRTFPSQPMLDFHIDKIHESKTKFPCDKCSRRFYRKSDLARHKIGTHKEKLL